MLAFAREPAKKKSEPTNDIAFEREQLFCGSVFFVMIQVIVDENGELCSLLLNPSWIDKVSTKNFKKRKLSFSLSTDSAEKCPYRSINSVNDTNGNIINLMMCGYALYQILCSS